MKKNVFAAITLVFSVFCGSIIVESRLSEGTPGQDGVCGAATGGRGCILLQQTTTIDTSPNAVPKPNTLTSTAPAETHLEAAEPVDFAAVGGTAERIVLGSLDPNTGFKFRLELDSQGAAIRRATLSEYDNNNYKNPQPLDFLSPVRLGTGREILSMANTELVFIEQQRQLGLDRLPWKALQREAAQDGSQVASFEVTITDLADKPVAKLTKTYTVTPGSYLVDCRLTIENLSQSQQKVRFNLTGPAGLNRELGRAEMNKVVAAFANAQGQMSSVRIDQKALAKAKTTDDRRLKPRKAGVDFLWAAAVNKYFAAVLVPVPDQGKEYCDWLIDRVGWFYNPDGEADSGDEAIGLDFTTAAAALEPAGSAEGRTASRTYAFQLYLGPKDKSLFDKNEQFRKIGFVETIDFMACCCPASIINPLAFGILAIMKWMYGFIGNYGVVIIILVLLMRLILHPVTRHSQVAMHKMSKLAPMTEEIKKKYANNKTEMNKRLMELYREHGASPIMGMLPMFVQMPIWIALWSAVYTSIDLRGAQFLPFWITDLSAPDALIRFRAFTIPLFGKIDSLNLLPLLMGVAFYLQQKLTPTQTGAATSPQMAQQQKMMMIMMPLLFPLMLYTAPSGVNLYIMASTFAGVIEQHVIKQHIKRKEDAQEQGLVAATSKTGGKVKKKRPKPFFRF